MRYYAGWCDKLDGELLPGSTGLSYVRPEPYGVIAAIPPWNGSMMGMGQKVAPALAAGNSVVVKAPEIAPFGMLRFAELALEAGVPRGVLNVVVGDAGAGEALVSHAGVDKITFTGGTATGRRVMAAAAENITPVTLELGGKSANIVFPDADLDAASSMAAMLGVGLLSGQGCASPTRLYVHEDVYDAVVTRWSRPSRRSPSVTRSTRRCSSVRWCTNRRSNGSSESSNGLGATEPICCAAAFAPAVRWPTDTSSHRRSSATSSTAATSRAHEVFGPVLAILRFSDEDEVVAKANDSTFGLAAYVHSRDVARIQRVAHQLEVGTVTVNGFPAMSPSAPFGGYKQSGFGREGGRAGIDEFLRSKSVYIAPTG